MIPDIHHYCNQFIRKNGLFKKIISYRQRELFVKDMENCSITCIYITLQDLRQVIIWDCSKKVELHDDIKKELIIHLQNSGSFTGYLFLKDSVSQVINRQEPVLEFKKEIQPLPELSGNDVIFEYKNIADALDSYLNLLHKTVSRIFYRNYGEGEPTTQRLIVLSGILQTILTKILLGNGVNTTAHTHSCILDLITLGSAIPGYPDNEPEIRIDKDICSAMVEEGCLIRVPEPLRIHLLDPVIAVRAFRRYLNRIKNQEKRKTEHTAGGCDLFSLISSPVLTQVIKSLREPGKKTAIIDPCAGDGELILLVLRLCNWQKKSPPARFKKIADTIFCADPSFSSVMLTRFGLVLHAIDGDLLNPDLFLPYPREVKDDFCSHVRTGNILLTREIEDEYLSDQQAKKAVYSLKPLDSGWLEGLADHQVILMTAPCREMNLKIPEIRQYLCKRYKSYSHEAMTALYTAELAIRTLRYDSYIFLPASWLSDMHAGPFRKVVRETRVTKIILEQFSENSKSSEFWSCICAMEHLPSIRIIRITDNGIITAYSLKREDLSESDGWNLEDPSEKEILNYLVKDTVSLFEYCLGALYRPGDLNKKKGCWLSIQFRHGELKVSSGDALDKDADIVIKGPDEYLEGLLQSRLIRWYCRYMRRTWPFVHPEQVIPAIPVYQPDWFIEEEKKYVKQITESLRKRLFLTRKLQYSLSFHDRERIRKKLLLIDERLNKGVYSLYQIPEYLQVRLDGEV